MSTQEITSTHHVQVRSMSEEMGQYNILQILGIWAGAALPVGLIYWVILPLLLSRGDDNPFTYLFLIVAAMIWQGVLAYILLRREVKPFTWDGVKKDFGCPHLPIPERDAARSGCSFGSSHLSC